MLPYRLYGAPPRPSTRNIPLPWVSSVQPVRGEGRVDGLVAAAVGEDRVVEAGEQVDVLGASGADVADRVGVRGVEHGGEAGHALDDLLVHDVGLVETGLWMRVDPVVDLDDQRRPRRVGAGSATGTPVNGCSDRRGRRRGGRRRGGRRRGERRRWPRRGRSVPASVVARSCSAGSAAVDGRLGGGERPVGRPAADGDATAHDTRSSTRRP